MRKEFLFWIIDSIEKRCIFANKPLNTEQRQDLIKTVQAFTNEDYEKVSDYLTSAIEDKLTLYGYGINDAIRWAWKWSD